MIKFSIFVNFIKKTEKLSNLSILDQGHGYWHINSKVTWSKQGSYEQIYGITK